MKYQIAINKVRVGELDACVVQAIHANVRRDLRTWVWQIANIIWASWRAICAGVQVLPAFVLAAIAFMAFFDASSFAAVWAAAMKSPQDAAEVIRNVLGWTTALCAFAALISTVVFGRTFGFRNIFALRLAEQIRQRIECSATGNVEWWQLPAASSQSEQSPSL